MKIFIVISLGLLLILSGCDTFYALGLKTTSTNETTELSTTVATTSINLTTQTTETIDQTKPVFTGVVDLETYIGTVVDYLNEVSASDDQDGDLTELISIDDTLVNLNKAGTYPVKYQVSDLSGNSATITINLTVIDPNIEVSTRLRQALNELRTQMIADLNELIDSDVTPNQIKEALATIKRIQNTTQNEEKSEAELKNLGIISFVEEKASGDVRVRVFAEEVQVDQIISIVETIKSNFGESASVITVLKPAESDELKK